MAEKGIHAISIEILLSRMFDSFSTTILLFLNGTQFMILNSSFDLTWILRTQLHYSFPRILFFAFINHSKVSTHFTRFDKCIIHKHFKHFSLFTRYSASFWRSYTHAWIIIHMTTHNPHTWSSSMRTYSLSPLFSSHNAGSSNIHLGKDIYIVFPSS